MNKLEQHQIDAIRKAVQEHGGVALAKRFDKLDSSQQEEAAREIISRISRLSKLSLSPQREHFFDTIVMVENGMSFTEKPSATDVIEGSLDNLKFRDSGSNTRRTMYANIRSQANLAPNNFYT